MTTPHIRLGGSGPVSLIDAAGDPGSWQQTTAAVLDNATYSWHVPFALAVGAAYTFRARLTLSADVKIHGRAARQAFVEHPTVGVLASSEREAVVNTALGAELLVHARVALRLGLFTNLSALPESLIDQGGERVNLFGLSLGGTLITSQASTVSFAVEGQIGSGRTSVPRIHHDGTTLRRDSHITETRQAVLIVSVGGRFDLR